MLFFIELNTIKKRGKRKNMKKFISCVITLIMCTGLTLAAADSEITKANTEDHAAVINDIKMSKNVLSNTVIKQLLEPRDEFETKKDYEKRTSIVNPNEVYYFTGESEYGEYNIDSKTLTIGKKSYASLYKNFWKISFNNTESTSEAIRLIDEAEESISTRMNSFGAETEVKDKTGNVYQAIIKYTPTDGRSNTSNVIAIHQGDSYKWFGVNLVVEPIYAKKVKNKDVEIMIIYGLQFCNINESNCIGHDKRYFRQATISSPTSLNVVPHAIKASIRSITVYDKTNDEILGVVVF